MSYARSPRGVCSTTMGMSATAPPTLARAVIGRFIPWRPWPWRRGGSIRRPARSARARRGAQGLGLAERQPQPVQLVAPLEHGSGSPGARGPESRASRAISASTSASPTVSSSRVGDGLEEERPAHRALGVRPQLGRELLVVPADARPGRPPAGAGSRGRARSGARPRGRRGSRAPRTRGAPARRPRPPPRAPGDPARSRSATRRARTASWSSASVSCAPRPRASSSSIGGTSFSFTSTTRSVSSPVRPRSSSARMPLGKPHLDPPLRARLEPDHGLVHLGKHPAAADLEGVALLGARLSPLPAGARSRPPRSRPRAPGAPRSRAWPAAPRARRASPRRRRRSPAGASAARSRPGTRPARSRA